VKHAGFVPDIAGVAMHVEDLFAFLEVRLESRFGPALYARFLREAVPVDQTRTNPCADVDLRTAAHDPGFALRSRQNGIRLAHEHLVGERVIATQGAVAVWPVLPQIDLRRVLAPVRRADAWIGIAPNVRTRVEKKNRGVGRQLAGEVSPSRP